jgi:hypothetical protein
MLAITRLLIDFNYSRYNGNPLFYRRWFSREPLDDKFVKSIIKSVMAAHRRPKG